MHRYFALLLVLPWPIASSGQAAAAHTPADAQALVERALENELRAAQDTGHPMRYKLRKTSPRLTSTKLLVETRDGLVARLVSINDQPLNAADEKKEHDRLDGLLSDPGKQRHRKQSEEADAGRALKVLRVLPKAFLYEPAGPNPGLSPSPDPNPNPSPASGTPASPSTGPAQRSGALAKFTFKPNPAFNPPDLETQALTAMTGELWIDPAQQRVTHLEGHLEQDVDFGWGILGRLNKGGWIVIEQADVDAGQWRVVRFKMQMSGRVLFKTKVFDTTEEETQFAPLPAGMDYRKAIELLRAASEPK